jgi:hypothetical protein
MINSAAWKTYPKNETKNHATDLVGEERRGFGGISNEFTLPSNISITLLIVGLSFGNV